MNLSPPKLEFFAAESRGKADIPGGMAGPRRYAERKNRLSQFGKKLHSKPKNSVAILPVNVSLNAVRITGIQRRRGAFLPAAT
jgi:hypothetical protein